MFIKGIILMCHLTAAMALYQDTSYPYDVGPLDIDTIIYNPTLMPINSPPCHNKVYFPTEEGDYAVFYFVTGYTGILPSAFYDELMSNISTHGYVVINTWPLAGDEGPSLTWEEHLENLDWLAENLQDDTGSVVPSFDDVAMGCHSAGCTPTLNMALNRTQQIKALVHLEPVSVAIRQKQPEHYLPSFQLGAELANMTCSFPGIDFETWHARLSCPKIMVEVADVGHCDLLDPAVWLTCTALNICPGIDVDYLEDYRMLVSGFSSAFMTAYIQGNMDQLDYITDIDKIPWTLLQHDVDIDC